MSAPQFWLFVAGNSGRSQRALAQLEELRRTRLASAEIEVVDVLEHPELAEEQRILATPTLVRRGPGPSRRIVGDLSDPAGIDYLLDGRETTPA